MLSSSSSSSSSAWLAHVVSEAPAADSDSASSAGASPRRWYPLHQLARWSGVVPAHAAPPVVKQAMAQAKATIDAHCKRGQRSLESVYRKLGSTVCVAEQAFGWSVRGWATMHPDNAQLRRFNEQIAATMQAVFHSDASSSSSAAPSTIDAEALRRKFAFDGSEDADDDATLLSASLAAPASQFSLAAFLDQHLQSAQAPAQGRSALEQSEADMEALAATRSELHQLQALWLDEQRSSARTNPALVAQASLSLSGYHAELTRLSAEHAAIQSRLAAHLETSAPMRESITTLQRNMQFIQLVQLYESLLRQATDLSERCKEALSGHVDPAQSTLATAEPELSAAAVDHNNVHSICTSFLKLLRIYQGLHETTAATAQMDNQSGPEEDRSWAGVQHLQSMVRTRILTILSPLHRKLIQLYQQTLATLHWPQTSHTLLLGLHVMPSATTSSAASSAPSASSPLSSPSSLDSSLSLFDTLTENLVRIQMMLQECGMHEEIRSVEREIEAGAGAMTIIKERKESTAGTGAVASPPARLWVLSLLLQPIYKRFYFHFDSTPPIVATSVDLAAGGDVVAAASVSSSASDSSAGPAAAAPSAALPSGASLTNRLDKPEWVLTFLEKIFTDHKDFLSARVQPIVTRCHFQAQGASTVHTAAGQQQQGVRFYEFNMEFLEALLGFYHAKLSRPSVQAALLSSPSLLRHTLDELASFEAKLEVLYGYPIHSARRLSLTDAFLRSPRAFAGVLKAERDAVNQSLDALREQKNPWALVHKQQRAFKMEGESSSDDEDDEPAAAASLDPSLDDGGDESLTLASNSATNSSHAFLSLLSRITLHAHSFKYLNHRLRLLRDLQFKLFEIYEEDLIRAFQANWRDIQTNMKKGGIKYLMIPARRRRATADTAATAGGGHARRAAAAHQKLNAFPCWSLHCGLLNSIDSILEVLAQHWNEESYFLELYYFYTHRTRILKDFSAAQGNVAAVKDKEAAASSSSDKKDDAHAPAATADEDEVLITSEEMALWMANGGQAPFAAASSNNAVTAEPIAQSAVAAAVESEPSAPDARTSYLPAGFQRTLDQLSALSKLSSMELTTSSAAAGSGLFESGLGGSSSAVSARMPVLTPTSDSLFPKLSAVELRLGAGGPNRGARGGQSLSSGLPPPLPADLSLSGTLFEPILASYSSLREEMLHSLVGLVVSHFREGIRASGYADRGHLGPDAHASRLGGLGPFAHADLDHFVSSCAALAAQGHTPAAQADWDLLEHHVEISRELAAPLMELKMQLMVGHHCLASSLHRSFWTAIASKLQSVCFDELVVGQYFTPRSGALQFLRDMRALILLFAPYQNAHTLSSASAGSGISTHFKLVQDTMNLLLLSSRQRTALLLDLTSGSLASSSPAVVKQHLARPPYQLQRMQGKQVVELLQHVREHTEEEQQQPQQEAQQEEDESQGQAEAEEDQDNEAHEPEEDPTDGAAAAVHADPLSPFEEDEPELEALEDLSPAHADQADDPAADLDAAEEEHEEEAAADPEDEAAADSEQAAVAEESEEAAVAEEADEQPFEDEDDASAAVEETGHSEAEDEDEDEAAEPVDFLAAAAARALASASAAAPTAADAPQDGPEEQEEEPNLDDFGGFPDEPDVDADEANDGVAP